MSALKFQLNEQKLETYPMYVTNPIVNDGLKKFVTYSLMGNAISSPIIRRFSDFYSLREKLLERWPAIYIPNIPPKKAVGNVDTKTIVFRMRLLNAFCLRISKIDYLFQSEEMKLFQSMTTDVSKLIEKMGSLPYSEIVSKYKLAFPNYYEEYDLILGRGKLLDFNSFLKKALHNLKNFKDTINDAQSQTESDINNYLALLKFFEDHEKYTLLEYAESDESKLVFFNPKNTEICEKVLKLKSNLDNPYNSFYEWLEEEELDIEAMLEALANFTNLNETYDKTSIKADQLDVDIKNLQAGQKSIKSIFSFKNKDESIAGLEREKKQCEENLIHIHALIKICCFNLEFQIEEFKQEKMKNYYRHLRLFSEMQKENNYILSDLWNAVEGDQSLQKVQSESA